MEAVDGEYQTYKSKDGAYVRKHFFNTPELRELVADYSDEDIWHLNRGGHDPFKVYAAYHAAQHAPGPAHRHPGQDHQGLRHGRVGRGAEHHPPAEEDVDRGDPPLPRPLPDPGARRQARRRCPTSSSREGSKELEYMQARRTRARRRPAQAPPQGPRRSRCPPLAAFERLLKGTEDREISTTMAFVQLLQLLLRDKKIGRRIVPIVPDESRTFGMEGLFRQLGIWSQVGQLYTPEDAEQLMFYREDKNGQILQEGINEAGAMCDWIAAATSYSVHGVPMIPFYIFYSMFGFQRVGDLAWAAGDMRSRGFLLGGTAGRTTLNGEGLQHEDGHSPRARRDHPQLRLLRPDLRLRGGGHHPGRPAPHVRGAGGRLLLPDGDERELRPPGHAGGRGARASSRACTCSGRGAGRAGRAARAAARLRHHLPRGDRGRRPARATTGAWRPTSGAARASPSSRATAMRRHAPEPAPPGRAAARARTSRPASPSTQGPVVAATDYVRAFAEQIRAYVPRRYVVLGTDGFGRSDTREKLRALLRGRPPPRDGGGAEGARRRGDDCPRRRSAEAIQSTASIPSQAAPWTV